MEAGLPTGKNVTIAAKEYFGNSMKMNARLEDANAQLLAEFKIPATKLAPYVIVWKNRAFSHYRSSPGEVCYCEVFTHVIEE